MDGGAWWAAVHGVAKSRTRLSDFTFTFHFHALEREMATHSTVLAWRIPGTGEPGGLPSMVSHRVGHDWSDLAAPAVSGKLRRTCGPHLWKWGQWHSGYIFFPENNQSWERHWDHSHGAGSTALILKLELTSSLSHYLTQYRWSPSPNELHAVRTEQWSSTCNLDQL